MNSITDKLRKFISQDEKVPSPHGKAKQNKSSDPNRPRSMSCEPAHSDHAQLFMALSSIEQRQLFQSWKQIRVKTGTKNLLVMVFEKIQEKKPQIGTLMFSNYALCDQGPAAGNQSTYAHMQYVFELLDTILAGGDGPNSTTLGRSHGHLRRAGFKPEYWDIFGQTFVNIFARKEIVGSTLAARAWQKFIAAITDMMLSGFNQEARQYTSTGPYSARVPRSPGVLHVSSDFKGMTRARSNSAIANSISPTIPGIQRASEPEFKQENLVQAQSVAKQPNHRYADNGPGQRNRNKSIHELGTLSVDPGHEIQIRRKSVCGYVELEGLHNERRPRRQLPIPKEAP